MPKFDDQEYAAGRNDFASGRSLRSIAEELMSAQPDVSEDKVMSRLLGFADGLVDALRKPASTIEPGEVKR